MNKEIIIVVVTILVLVLIATISIITAGSREERINCIKEWLKYAVVLAEKELGSGTGQLKLRKVYDMAVTKFPQIMLFISFDTFSKWVDEALEWMNKQLTTSISK